MKKLKIIVGGNIGLFPTGGAAWDYVQYPLGFKLMGHDVYYIEDTCMYPIYQKEGVAWNDASGCVNYLADVMNYFDMSDRWAYRDIASGRSFGMNENQISDLCKSADVFINISCSTFMRDEYLKIPHRILIDSDPMFTQIQYFKEINNESDAKSWTTKKMIDSHNYLFTFGENINNDDCLIPKFGYKWIPTHQPICLDYWKNEKVTENFSFTTVMNWSGRKKLSYNNDEWGQKDIQFLKYKTLPGKIKSVEFSAIINRPLNAESKLDIDELTSNGWNVLSPEIITDIHSYKNFILGSSAEFSVAKETYVKSVSGWFSCRSACYLASSRPVIAQETGWSKIIPAGHGVFTFNDMQSAVDSAEEVISNYKLHSKAAAEIAHEYFDSKNVLQQMLNELH